MTLFPTISVEKKSQELPFLDIPAQSLAAKPRRFNEKIQTI
jgi:hypothetical protein